VSGKNGGRHEPEGDDRRHRKTSLATKDVHGGGEKKNFSKELGQIAQNASSAKKKELKSVLPKKGSDHAKGGTGGPRKLLVSTKPGPEMAPRRLSPAKRPLPLKSPFHQEKKRGKLLWHKRDLELDSNQRHVLGEGPRSFQKSDRRGQYRQKKKKIGARAGFREGPTKSPWSEERRSAKGERFVRKGILRKDCQPGFFTPSRERTVLQGEPGAPVGPPSPL